MEKDRTDTLQKRLRRVVVAMITAGLAYVVGHLLDSMGIDGYEWWAIVTATIITAGAIAMLL